tara:strand:- start:3778 stop:4413 length:636 start_codon:yes stop_codon:yes gene_type:complete
MRITNVNTLSSLLDRLVTENIKLFFFKKSGDEAKISHQNIVILHILHDLDLLFEEANMDGYSYLGENRTFTETFSKEIGELIMNDIRIGEADRARLEEVTKDDTDFYRLAFNEIRLRISNEGRAKNKNNIDEVFKKMTDNTIDLKQVFKKMTDNTINLKQVETPKHAGAYQITGKGSEANSMRFNFVKKPNLVNRFFCRILLGWVWIDESK